MLSWPQVTGRHAALAQSAPSIFNAVFWRRGGWEFRVI